MAPSDENRRISNPLGGDDSFSGRARASIACATTTSPSGFPHSIDPSVASQPRVIRSDRQRRYEVWRTAALEFLSEQIADVSTDPDLRSLAQSLERTRAAILDCLH
jgi:hypothetical protein